MNSVNESNQRVGGKLSQRFQLDNFNQAAKREKKSNLGVERKVRDKTFTIIV